METVDTKIGWDIKYSVIYADVPWEDERWFLDRIKDVPVINWVAKDALILLWVPNGALPEGLLVLGEWGFEYAGLLAWKKPKDRVDTFYPTSTCEYMLIGKVGTVKTEQLLRNVLYEGPASAGGYRPPEFRAMLGAQGHYAFGNSARYLDVFGEYWQGKSTDYERGSWDFLIDF
jgi:N6-adenosine-specific RNA methylase IME4